MENDTFRRNFRDGRAFVEGCTFLVLAHVDKNKTVFRPLAEDMNIEVQVRKTEKPLHSQIVESDV